MTHRQKMGVMLMAAGGLGVIAGLSLMLTGIFWQLKFMSGETNCRPTWMWYECVSR